MENNPRASKVAIIDDTPPLPNTICTNHSLKYNPQMCVHKRLLQTPPPHEHGIGDVVGSTVYNPYNNLNIAA